MTLLMKKKENANANSYGLFERKKIAFFVGSIQLIVLLMFFIFCFGKTKSYDVSTSGLSTIDIREGISVAWNEENLQIENGTGKVIVMTFYSIAEKLFPGIYDMTVQYISQKSSDVSKYNANASTGYCNVVYADDKESAVVKMDDLVFRDGQTSISGKFKVSNGLLPANLQVRVCYEGEGALQISSITLTELRSGRWLRFFECLGLFFSIDILILLMMGEKTHNIGDKLLVFVVCFMPKFIIAINSVMVYYVSDEISAMSIAAFAAGYDWKDVISNAGYYGIGYIAIFFPLFKLGISAFSIYRIILATNAVLIGFTGVICYIILEKFFAIKNRFIKISIAIVCGSISIFSNEISCTWNEDIYLLCGWIFAFIILNLLDGTVRNKRKYEIGLFLLMVYMLTVHTRAVTYIIAFALVCLVYWLVSRKKLISSFFWLAGIVGYIVVELLLKMYQQQVWQSASVRNSSLGDVVSSAASQIALDFTMIKSCLMIILGQFFTAFSLSGGLFVIAFAVFVLFAMYCCKNKDKLSHDDANLVLLGSMYGFMVIFTICGQSITWGVGVYDGLISGTTNYVYSYKAFTYMRYMGSYVPVFIMVTLIVAYYHWEMWKKSCRLLAPIMFAVLFVFWNNEIVKYFLNNGSNNMEAFVILVKLKDGTNIIWNTMFILLFTMVFFWMFLCYRKTFVIQLLLIGVLYTGYERMAIFDNMLDTEKYFLERVSSGYTVMQQLRDELLSDDIDICVVESVEKSDNQVWYLYQFVYYDLHIIPASTDDITETDIVFSNGEIGEYLADDYVCFELDGNEYLYSKNESYTMVIEEMGYEAE